MGLKYVDKPWGIDPPRDVFDRFPKHARPIATAPEQTLKPVIIYNSDGVGHPAVYHRGLWNRTEVLFDPYTAKTRTVMTGETIHDATMWSPSS